MPEVGVCNRCGNQHHRDWAVHIASRRGPMKAIVAIEHAMLAAIWNMTASGALCAMPRPRTRLLHLPQPRQSQTPRHRTTASWAPSRPRAHWVTRIDLPPGSQLKDGRQVGSDRYQRVVGAEIVADLGAFVDERGSGVLDCGWGLVQPRLKPRPPSGDRVDESLVRLSVPRLAERCVGSVGDGAVVPVGFPGAANHWPSCSGESASASMVFVSSVPPG